MQIAFKGGERKEGGREPANRESPSPPSLLPTVFMGARDEEGEDFFAKKTAPMGGRGARRDGRPRI